LPGIRLGVVVSNLCARTMQSTTMYEFTNFITTSANQRDDQQSATLTLELGAVSASLSHQQPVVVISSASANGRGRGGMDLSVSGQKDESYSPASSASPIATASLSACQRQHPAETTNVHDCTTMKEPLEYVGDLRTSELFSGTNTAANSCIALYIRPVARGREGEEFDWLERNPPPPSAASNTCIQ